MEKIILGIDPANNGAAVVMYQGKIIDVFSWKYLRRKKGNIFKVSHDSGEIELGDGAEIGHFIAQSLEIGEEGIIIACEDSYVGANPRSAISITRFSGQLTGAIKSYWGASWPIDWVPSGEWRSKVLGLSYFTKRAICKKVSLQKIPVLIPSILPWLDSMGELDHITDAGGVALWASKNQNIPKTKKRGK